MNSKIFKISSEVCAAIEHLTYKKDKTIKEIEKFIKAQGTRKFYRFPDNWCDYGSIILAKHLAIDLKNSN